MLTDCKYKYVKVLCLLLTTVFLASGRLAVAQEGEQQSNTDVKLAPAKESEFNLNASVVDGLELSRDGLKKAPLTKQAATSEAPLLEPQVSSPTAVATAMPPLPQAMQPDGAFNAPQAGAGQGGGYPQAPQSAPNSAVPLQTGASVVEYGVDWSRWMSEVADRWYFQLRRLEAQSPYEFYTDGPAQIEFTCYSNGQIGNVILRRSCGVPVYDQMQIEALLSSRPLPLFPRGTQRTSYTLCQGWEAHARHTGETDFQPGSFGKNTPMETVQRWD